MPAPAPGADARPDDPPPGDARAAEAMALLATLSTAGEWLVGFRARQAGHDPSEQEADVDARHALTRDAAGLAEMLMRLAASLALPADADPLTARVRHFDRLLVLRRVGRLLHAIHQRMLSLYPSVPDVLVEEARALEAQGARLAAFPPERLSEPGAAFVARALRFAADAAA